MMNKKKWRKIVLWSSGLGGGIFAARFAIR